MLKTRRSVKQVEYQAAPSARQVNQAAAFITDWLDFVLNNAFRKIFLTTSYDIANECILFFSCSVSDAIYRRKLKF